MTHCKGSPCKIKGQLLSDMTQLRFAGTAISYSMSQLCQTLQRAWVDAVVQKNLFQVYHSHDTLDSPAQSTSSGGYFKASATPFTRCGTGYVDGGNLGRIVITACCYQLKLQTDACLQTLPPVHLWSCHT